MTIRWAPNKSTILPTMQRCIPNANFAEGQVIWLGTPTRTKRHPAQRQMVRCHFPGHVKSLGAKPVALSQRGHPCQQPITNNPTMKRAILPRLSPPMDVAPTVYLGISGVLHPSDSFYSLMHGRSPWADGHSKYESAPVLVQALESWPDVEIILTSTQPWAHGLTSVLDTSAHRSLSALLATRMRT